MAVWQDGVSDAVFTTTALASAVAGMTVRESSSSCTVTTHTTVAKACLISTSGWCVRVALNTGSNSSNRSSNSSVSYLALGIQPGY